MGLISRVSSRTYRCCSKMSGISTPWNSAGSLEADSDYSERNSDIVYKSRSEGNRPAPPPGKPPVFEILRVFRRKFAPHHFKEKHWKDLAELMINLEAENFSQLRHRAESDLDSAHQRIRNYKDQNRDLHRKLDGAEAALRARDKRDAAQESNLQKRYDAMKDVVREMESKMNYYESDVKRLDQEKRRLQSDKALKNKAFEEERDGLQYKIDSLRKQNESVKILRLEKGTLQEQCAKLQTGANTHTCQIKDLRLKNEILTDELESAKYGAMKKKNAGKMKAKSIGVQTAPGSQIFVSSRESNRELQTVKDTNKKLELEKDIITEAFQGIKNEKVILEKGVEQQIIHIQQDCSRRIQEVEEVLATEKDRRAECERQLHFCEARLDSKKNEVILLEQQLQYINPLGDHKTPSSVQSGLETRHTFIPLKQASEEYRQGSERIQPARLDNTGRSHNENRQRKIDELPRTTFRVPNKRPKVQVVGPIKQQMQEGASIQNHKSSHHKINPLLKYESSWK